jgi:hypothetical protein
MTADAQLSGAARCSQEPADGPGLAGESGRQTFGKIVYSEGPRAGLSGGPAGTAGVFMPVARRAR